MCVGSPACRHLLSCVSACTHTLWCPEQSEPGCSFHLPISIQSSREYFCLCAHTSHQTTTALQSTPASQFCGRVGTVVRRASGKTLGQHKKRSCVSTESGPRRARAPLSRDLGRGDSHVVRPRGFGRPQKRKASFVVSRCISNCSLSARAV